MFVVTMILPQPPISSYGVAYSKGPNLKGLTPHLTYVAWQPSQIFDEISCVGCCGDPQGLGPEEKH